MTAAAPDIAPERVENLMHELIDQSLLITDLRPPLTCRSPAEWVLRCLADIPEAHDVHRRLEVFLRATGAWDSCPVVERASAYRRLAAAAVELGANAGEPPVQVDTSFALTGDLIRREVGEEAARAASLMLRLSPLPRGLPYLHAYYQAFVARYGEHREVSLLELLDPHWGLGPAGALNAEIVYLPRTFRLANVAVRPATSAHEIAIGVSVSAPLVQNIPLDELTVGVNGGRFYLRWPGHAERVRVSSSHMLNFLEAPSICRFLAHMDADENTQLHVFDWGPASSFSFLPRVQVGKNCAAARRVASQPHDFGRRR